MNGKHRKLTQKGNWVDNQNFYAPLPAIYYISFGDYDQDE